MTRRRGILIGIALLAVVAVVLVALAFNSSLQTRVARSILADQPGLDASLEQVDIGWSTVRVDNLLLRQDGVVLRVPQVEAELPLWRLAFNDVRVGRLVAHDWELQIEPGATPVARTETTYPPEPATATADWSAGLRGFAQLLATSDGAVTVSPLNQILEALSLPVDVALGGVDLSGRARWRDIGPGADGHAQVKVQGGGLAAGAQGNFTLLVEAQGARASSAGIQSLTIDARIAVTMEDARTVGAVGLAADLAGRREDRTEPDRFTLEAELSHLGEAPRASVALRDERVQLLNLELTQTAGAEGLAGTWAVGFDHESAGSLMLGQLLPEFALRGEGELSASSDLSTGAIAGELHYTMRDLDMVQPELSAIGEVRGQIGFDLNLRENNLRCTRFTATLEGAAPVLSFRLLQGVEVAHDTHEVRVMQPEEPVFALDLMGLPTAWAQPWLEPMVLDAQAIQGTLVGLVTGHGLRLVTSEDVTVRGLVVAEDGRTLLEGIDLNLSVGAEVTGDGWQVELDRLEVSDADGYLGLLSARGGQLRRENQVLKLAGHFESDLRVLQRVPLAAGSLALETGRVSGELGLGLEERVSLAAAISVTNLTLADGQALPEMQLDGRVDLLPDGGLEAHLPMRFTQDDRISDLTLNMSAKPSAEGWLAEGSLTGPRAYVSDLQGLGLIVAAAPEAPGAEASPAGPDQTDSTRPIWAGWQGTFKTAVGELTLPNGMVLENVRGDIVLDALEVKLDSVSAQVGSGGSVTMQGGLDFDANRPATYAATGAISAESVDVGALLRVIDPTQLPTLEGRLNLTAQLNSAASDLQDLMDQASLEARVTSAGGVLRALQVDVEQYLQTGRTLAAVGGLFAALSGNETLGRRAQRLQTLTTVAERLAAVSFDQLNLEVNRAPGGNMVLRDLAVISPGLRLLGNGSIRYSEDMSWWTAPLALTLQLAAREDVGDMLARLNLVESEADALGYRPLVQAINLDGSLAHVGTAELGRLLSRALDLR
ncbi:hypothetical protein [Actomonas aquatica]|uniref:AsmA domain-containing protein n=1 Tax=Actomonas aquatica TaxID=2866162 RepID=A0ABZ1C7T1_9BACT|nr:hypothetical protein [Opitutus sp. WL0086]WRQ87761.1 hypothetical protein K1X11_023360 [Opitutus sp. WL0086]